MAKRSVLESCKKKHLNLPELWQVLEDSFENLEELERRRKVSACFHSLVQTLGSHLSRLRQWPERGARPLYTWGQFQEMLTDALEWAKMHPTWVREPEVERLEALQRSAEQTMMEQKAAVAKAVARGKVWLDLLGQPEALRKDDFWVQWGKKLEIDDAVRSWDDLREALGQMARTVRLAGLLSHYHGWEEEYVAIEQVRGYLESRGRAFTGWLTLLKRADEIATESKEAKGDSNSKRRMNYLRAVRDIVCGDSAVKTVQYDPVYEQAARKWCEDIKAEYEPLSKAERTASKAVQNIQDVITSFKALLELAKQYEAQGIPLDEVVIEVAADFQEKEGKYESGRLEIRPLQEALSDYRSLVATELLVRLIRERLAKTRQALRDGKAREALAYLEELASREEWQQREAWALPVPRRMVEDCERLAGEVKELVKQLDEIEQRIEEAAKARHSGQWKEAEALLTKAHEVVEAAENAWKSKAPELLGGGPEISEMDVSKAFEEVRKAWERESERWLQGIRAEVNRLWTEWQQDWREGNWEAVEANGKVLEQRLQLVRLQEKGIDETLKTIDDQFRQYRTKVVNARLALQRAEREKQPAERWAQLQRAVTEVATMAGGEDAAERLVRRWIGTLWDDTRLAVEQEKSLSQWEERLAPLAEALQVENVEIEEVKREARKIREGAEQLQAMVRTPLLQERVAGVLKEARAIEVIAEARLLYETLKKGEIGRQQYWPEGLMKRLKEVVEQKTSLQVEALDLQKKLEHYRKKWEEAERVLEEVMQVMSQKDVDLEDLKKVYQRSEAYQREPTPVQSQLTRLIRKVRERYAQGIRNRLERTYEAWERDHRGQDAASIQQLCQMLEEIASETARQECPRFKVPLLQGEIQQQRKQLEKDPCSRAILKPQVEPGTMDCERVAQAWESVRQKLEELATMSGQGGIEEASDVAEGIWQARKFAFFAYMVDRSRRFSWEDAKKESEFALGQKSMDEEWRALYVRAALEIQTGILDSLVSSLLGKR